jgi:hypothetical protein
MWNVQGFTNNKIDVAAGEVVRFQDINGFELNATIGVNALRMTYMLDNVAQFDPDIFVVIEVISPQGPRGSLLPAESPGGAGCLFLLNVLRHQQSPNWRLVPPQRLVDKIQVQEYEPGREEIVRDGAYTEAIAVYFRADRLSFEGPYIWPKVATANPKVAVPPAIGVESEPYPEPWNGALNGGVTNNQHAGQANYVVPWHAPAPDQPLGFPTISSRSPFTTQFRELGGRKRVLTLASVHFPPQAETAVFAYTNTMGYFKNVHLRSAEEIIVIAGDFNISPNDPAHSAILRDGQWGFTTLFVNRDVNPPTIYRRSRDATPTDYYKDTTLDNLSFWKGFLVGDLGWFRMAVNRVRTSDRAPELLMVPYDEIVRLPEEAAERVFRLPWNFGRLGAAPGTSDHLAMFYEVTELP